MAFWSTFLRSAAIAVFFVGTWLSYDYFDVLRGGINANSSAALGVPFGPGAGSVNTNTFAAALGLSPGISQDVKPQDDQDFYRGILTPLISSGPDGLPLDPQLVANVSD